MQWSGTPPWENPHKNTKAPSYLAPRRKQGIWMTMAYSPTGHSLELCCWSDLGSPHISAWEREKKKKIRVLGPFPHHLSSVKLCWLKGTRQEVPNLNLSSNATGWKSDTLIRKFTHPKTILRQEWNYLTLFYPMVTFSHHCPKESCFLWSECATRTQK